MNRNIRILAGTALATVMASASAGAFPARNPVPTGFEPAILLAQSDESVEELRPRGGGSEEAEPRERRKQRAERQAEPEGRQAQEEPRRREASEDEAERPRQKRAREAERQADEEQAEPRRKAREARQAEEQPAAAEQERPRRKSREAQAEEPPEAGEAERQVEQERPRKKSREARQAEEQQEPQAEEPARRKPRQAEQDAQPGEADRQRAGSAEESDPQAEEQRPRDRRKAREAAQDAERQRAEEQQREEAAPEEARPAERQRRDGEQQRETEDEPARAETPEDGDRPTERADPDEATSRERTVREDAPDDGSAAPVLDSQKQRPREERDRDQARDRERDRDREQAGDSERPRTGEDQARERREEPRTDEPPVAEVPAGPPPDSDRAAQESVRRAEIRPVIAEEGRRREGRPDDDRWRRRERPEGTDVLREIGDRLILGLGDQVIVESNDRPRMARGAREVYYEDLPRGRTREVIVRADGTRVVTIRNAYGDVIRRSRIAPDDREYILAYVEEDDYDRVRDWRDPGLDLPPLRLDIPEEEYILDAAAVEEPDVYYEFLEQPPVERVERLYSVDEVKRSARIRDKTRRIDLDTLTFEFGSASIPEDQIPRLEGIAQAIERLLEKNPAETILIEGHTDAVGSDLANLALSDRRAEAVAEALTNVFAIPPENLSTQGYGEEFLKVRTQAPERENRRVAIRRITPLVAPVASAQ